MSIRISYRMFRRTDDNNDNERTMMRWFNWLLIVMLTVNVNYVRCADTMENSTMKPTKTAINISCTLSNVTDMLKVKSSCDNEITYLFVKESHFDTLPRVFEYYPKLQSVDISMAGFQHIESTTFDSAMHLTTLILSGSNMRTLQNNLFSHANNLTVFTMANSSIETIEKYAFHGLSNLKNLDLSYNKIVSLDAEIFHPLSQLDHIRLNNNKIQVINNDLFLHNLQLKWAYFSSNEIIIVESNAFLNGRLQALDLGLNSLLELDVTTAKYLKNLIISGNQLTTLKVPSTIVEIHAENNSISVLQSEENSALSNLFLSSNHFTNLHSLENFKKMTFLDLSSNHFQNFPFSELRALTQLKELKLCGNKLAEIKVDDVVANLPKLEIIELSTKHWSDAYIKQLEGDLKNHSIVLGQDRSIIPDDDHPSIKPTTMRPTSPVTQRSTTYPIIPTPSPNAGDFDRKLYEISKKLSDLEYKTGANAAADSKKIDGRLLDIEDKLMKLNANSSAKYEEMESTFKVYEVLVIIMFVSLSIFLLYKVVINSKSLCNVLMCSKSMFNGMQYRHAQSSDPIFSEQDL